jgi:hypothetical protein
MLVLSAAKSTAEVSTTVTPMEAVLEPHMLVAVMVTTYVPGLVKVWNSGS